MSVSRCLRRGGEIKKNSVEKGQKLEKNDKN